MTINDYTIVVGRVSFFCIVQSGFWMIFFILQVKHSQRMNERLLHVWVKHWVMCGADGSVETAHCTCMAGAGEV
jgi:hypothetical protein